MKDKVIAGIIIATCLLSLIMGVMLIVRGPDSISIFNMNGKQDVFIPQSDGVAVVYIYGPIYISEDDTYWYRFMRGSDRIVQQLKRVTDNPSIKAVVLRINSPGGSVGAVQEIFSAIKEIRAKGKKVVVSMGDVCASGGYYISCACDSIVANQGSITGSIGVIMSKGNMEELFRKIGVEIEVVKSGKYKDMGSMSRKMTGDEKKLLQGVIDDAYEQFFSVVVEGRKLQPEKVRELCQGQVFTGHQAKELGLVDELGDMKEAIKVAGRLAGIKGQPKVIDIDRPMKNLFDFMLNAAPSEMLKSIIQDKSGVRLEYMLR